MNTAQKIVVGVAIALWVAAVLRITSAANSKLPPTRWTDFRAAEGPLTPPSWPHIHSPRFFDGEAVWAYGYDYGQPPQGAFIRFDLPARRADMLWPLPGSNPRDVMGFAAGAGGDRFVALRGAGEAGPLVVRLAAGGGATPLGYPAGAKEDVIGLAATAEAVELVTGAWDPPVVHRRPLAGGDWTSAPAPPPPCPEGSRCGTDAAQREADGWRLWAVRQPRTAPASGAATVEVLAAAPGGEWAVAQTFPAPAAAYEGGELARLTRLERGVGGGVFLGGDAGDLVLERRDGAWAPFAAPTVAGTRLDVPDFVVTARGLEWIPEVETPRGAQRVRGRWLALRASAEGYRLGSLDTGGGPPLSDDGWLDSDPALVPARDGGFWVLGAFGTHVRVDDELERTDAPGFFERVALLYDNFRRLARYNDFWLSLPVLKMAVLPVVLGLLPLFTVVSLVARRRRWLPGLALLYVVLAGPSFYWFWRLTNWI